VKNTFYFPPHLETLHLGGDGQKAGHNLRVGDCRDLETATPGHGRSQRGLRECAVCSCTIRPGDLEHPASGNLFLSVKRTIVHWISCTYLDNFLGKIIGEIEKMNRKHH